MAVVPLTVMVSLCLAFTFIVFFLSQHARGRLSSAERDALLPLEEEEPRLGPVLGGDLHDHSDPCGCRSGIRPPCPGCLKRGASRP